MTKSDDGGPAFPFDPTLGATPGMSLRDWFAGQALVVFLNPGWNDATSIAPADAYRIADLMLAERAKGNNE